MTRPRSVVFDHIDVDDLHVDDLHDFYDTT
jgi:hypothetical protein